MRIGTDYHHYYFWLTRLPKCKKYWFYFIKWYAGRILWLVWSSGGNQEWLKRNISKDNKN